MKATLKALITCAAIASQLFFGTAAMADVADSSSAAVVLSGNVPTIFSLTARGLPGDLDLTPGVSVTDRTVGIFHFKYNLDIATLTLASTSATGTPMNGATAFPAGTAFTYKFAAGCASVNATGLASFSIALGVSPALVNAAAGQPSTLGYGIEEDCQLTASWGGQTLAAGQIPLSGVYSETLTLTMVSP
jgi:hypothetical protein